MTCSVHATKRSKLLVYAVCRSQPKAATRQTRYIYTIPGRGGGAQEFFRQVFTRRGVDLDRDLEAGSVVGRAAAAARVRIARGKTRAWQSILVPKSA
eukprot:4740858-Prymnesium_polylepis.1